MTPRSLPITCYFRPIRSLLLSAVLTSEGQSFEKQGHARFDLNVNISTVLSTKVTFLPFV